MSKVIRSHPVVGSRKLQAPYQEDDRMGRFGEHKSDDSLSHDKEPTRNANDDRVERHSGKDQGLAEISPALLNELKKSLDAETEKRVFAEQKLADLQEQLDAINHDLSEEKRKGYEKGLIEGNTAAEGKIAHQYKEVSEVSNLFNENLTSKINDAEKLSVEIAFEALCKIIGENYAADSFRRAVIENVISSLKDLSDLKVHINPKDASAVSSLSGKIGYSDVTFVADDRVGKGGCIVESSSGSWDGRLETQLQRLKETLVSVIRSDELGA